MAPTHRLEAAPARRVFAVAVMFALGGLLLWIALAGMPLSVWTPAVAIFGLGALWAGDRMRRATALALELTEDGLRDSSGRTLARWEDMVRVDRGTFALRPSNGFLLRLTAPDTRVWAPGLWWRIGQWVGVGGVTSGPATRALADRIALRLAERDS